MQLSTFIHVLHNSKKKFRTDFCQIIFQIKIVFIEIIRKLLNLEFKKI